MTTNKFYYKDGSVLNRKNDSKILHRENGPAVEWANGDKGWYLNDIEYSKKAFEAKLKEVDNLPTIVKLTHPEQWIRKRVKTIKIIGDNYEKWSSSCRKGDRKFCKQRTDVYFS